MRTENLRNLATSLVASLLISVPVSAAAGGEAAGTAAAADPAMPAMLRLALARSHAADVATSYRLDAAGRGVNPRHGLDLAFTPRGARIDTPAGGFALHLERFGRGEGRPVRRAAPHIDGAWVEYDRGAGLTEWFINLPGGVEQGWTVTERPVGGGPLVIELDTGRTPDENGDRRLAWSKLVYHRLVALDASGRQLPATWVVESTRLRIEVDDRDSAYPLLIDPWVQQAKLVADDGVANDGFGLSVALGGDTALIGALAAAVGGNDSQGAAYVFTRSGDLWSQQAKLTADDGAANDFFGDSVALTGNTALVGASGATVGGNAFQGAAYVFTRSDGVWSQRAKLIADDGTASAGFGSAVALAGGTALVGAQGATVGGNTDQGAAYVFTGGGALWSQRAKLTADDGAAGDGIGGSVALAGDTALVGSGGVEVDGDATRGAAYVFIRGGGVWSQQAKLIAEDGAAGDHFGDAVALTGDTALVGATGADVGGVNWGAAYVFTRSGDVWNQQAKLSAADPSTNAGFGWSVALAGDIALVGAQQAEVGESIDQGAAYVFIRSGDAWSQRAKLTADDGAAGDLLGVSAALAGDTALVGTGRSFQGLEGAVYVFLPPLTPVALAVDPEPMASADGDGIFEPGETVDVTPAWRNNDTAPLDVMGTASGFTGPLGATYTVVEDGADYGTLDPGQSASCLDTATCYVMGLDDPARPATHWDATFDETLDDPDGTATTWTLHIGASFTDVPQGSLFYRWVETLLHRRVTGGCAATTYCPAAPNTRAQIAVFLLKALEGSGYAPPECTGVFADVPCPSLFADWIEDLVARGVTAGCGGGDYCPGNPVNRDQMAVFLLKTLEGPGYAPPACTGVFGDVPCPSLFASWIEDLVARGITAGCGGGNYCPANPVSRDQMAVFLTKTFGLTLYGP